MHNQFYFAKIDLILEYLVLHPGIMLFIFMYYMFAKIFFYFGGFLFLRILIQFR